MLGKFTYSLLRPKYWLAWIALFILWLFSFVPFKLKQRLLNRIGKKNYAKNPRRQTAVHANLNLCYPHLNKAEKQQIVDAYQQHAAWALADMSWIWFRSIKQVCARTRIINAQFLPADKSTPIIFLCPHMLWLEYAVLSLADRYPMAGIFNTFPHPVLDWAVNRKRAQMKPRAIRRQSGKTIDQLVNAVKDGFSVFHLMDEDYGAKRSVFAPFFGVPKATLANIGDLIQRSNALLIPVCPMYCANSNMIDVKIYPPLDLRQHSADALYLAQQVNQAYETMIKECPAQYMWSLLYFKSSPPGNKRDIYGDYVALSDIENDA